MTTAPTVFSFCVEGPPVPKGRAIPLGGGRSVTPDKTRMYLRLVKTVCSLRCPPGWDKSGLFRVDLGIYVPDRRKRDLDNIEKAVFDAMKGVAYHDDHQIDETGPKRRIIDKLRPRVEVTVRRVG